MRKLPESRHQTMTNRGRYGWSCAAVHACELTTHDTNTPWPAPTTFRRHCISVSSPAATWPSGVHHHRRPSDVQPPRADGTNGSLATTTDAAVVAAFGTRTGRAPNALATSDIDTTPSLAMLYAPGGGSGCGQGDRGRMIGLLDWNGRAGAGIVGTAASALAGLAYLVDRSRLVPRHHVGQRGRLRPGDDAWSQHVHLERDEPPVISEVGM